MALRPARRARLLCGLGLSVLMAVAGACGDDGPETSPEPTAGPRPALLSFASDRDGTTAIYVVELGQASARRVPIEGEANEPAWSPSGDRVAFTRNVVTQDATGRKHSNLEIFVAAADASWVRRLTDDPGWDVAPAWSPDGTELAFASDRDGSLAVYVMAADGTGLRRLARGSEPAWSPDGRRLAYVDGPSTMVMAPDGSDPVEVGVGFKPTWSPDGSRLAVLRVYRGDGIYLLDVDGDGERQVYRGDTEVLQVSWSPDGALLAFASQRDSSGGADIYVVGVDGAGLRRITTDPAVDQYPAWVPGVVTPAG